MTIGQRLELFLAVCRAVQHAHHKGVIHRDLKPSNVLVMEQEGAAVPKVIEFGIAKATEQWAVENTLLTQFGQLVDTPEYASPEQAEVMTGDIDERRRNPAWQTSGRLSSAIPRIPRGIRHSTVRFAG